MLTEDLPDLRMSNDLRALHDQQACTCMDKPQREITRKEIHLAHTTIIRKPLNLLKQDAEVISSLWPVWVDLTVAAHRENTRSRVNRGGRRARPPPTLRRRQPSDDRNRYRLSYLLDHGHARMPSMVWLMSSSCSLFA